MLFCTFQSGYYLPDVELIREEYRVVQPPMQNLRPLGVYVWYECRRFDTYRLERHNPGDPIGKEIVVLRQNRSLW